jgi:predicted Zn-ribbon and HTH transcriptional regulator
MKLKCPHCGYKWEARVKQPKACPKCKRYIEEKK